MKLSYVTFAFLSLIIGSFPASADRMINFFFGNTVGPSAGLTCTENDKILMAPIFNISSYKSRRQLRSVITNATTTHIDDRGLQGNECKNRCQGYVGGMCHPMRICNINRRALQAEFNPLYATCSNHIAEMNARLDQLIATSTALSADCKTLIRKENRNATCEDGIVNGEISGFTVTRVSNPASKCLGMALCTIDTKMLPDVAVTSNDVRIGSGGGRFVISLDVVVHLIPCISTLEITVVGPSFNNKRIVTMSSRDSLSALAFTYYKRLYAGKYTVTAIPNNNLSKAKSFTITVA